MASSPDRLPSYEPQFREKGFYEWKARVAGKDVVVSMTREDVRDAEPSSDEVADSSARPPQLQRFADYDTSFIEHLFPRRTDVLTIHGTADKTVPVEDAYIYNDILSTRSPGTHELHIIEGPHIPFYSAKCLLSILRRRDTHLRRQSAPKRDRRQDPFLARRSGVVAGTASEAMTRSVKDLTMM